MGGVCRGERRARRAESHRVAAAQQQLRRSRVGKAAGDAAAGSGVHAARSPHSALHVPHAACGGEAEGGVSVSASGDVPDKSTDAVSRCFKRRVGWCRGPLRQWGRSAVSDPTGLGCGARVYQGAFSSGPRSPDAVISLPSAGGEWGGVEGRGASWVVPECFGAS